MLLPEDHEGDSRRKREAEELRSWVPTNHRFGTWAHCTYCGETPNVQDHVIPWAMLYYEDRKTQGKKPQSQGLRCLSCAPCNALLGPRYFVSMERRLDYVHQTLAKKYKRVLAIPDWSAQELRGMGRNLKKEIQNTAKVKAEGQRRICWRYSSQLWEIMTEAQAQVLVEYPENKRLHEFLGVTFPEPDSTP